MNLRQMTVKAKLSAGFGVLAAIVLVVSGLSVKALNDSNDRFSSYVAGISARAEMAERVRTAVDRRVIASNNLVLLTKPADLETEKAAVIEAQNDVQSRLRKLNEMMYGATDTSEKARSLVAEINRIEATYGPVAQAIVNLALDNKRDEAVTKINEEGRPLLAALIKASKDYSAFTASRAAQMVEEAAQHGASQRNLLIAICLAALGVAALAGVLITRGLTRALGAEPAALGEVTKRIAGGDLSPVPGAQHAPAGSVLASMGEMQGSLVNLIAQVRSAAESIASGSSQIAAGNVDLSSRTEEQAASLEETASSTTAVDAKNPVVRNRGAGNGIAGRGTDACAAMWTTTARTRLNEHHAITSGKAVGGSPARLAAPNRQVFFLPCTRRVTSAA
jgi:CHASE3 domain sensor protein